MIQAGDWAQPQRHAPLGRAQGLHLTGSQVVLVPGGQAQGEERCLEHDCVCVCVCVCVRAQSFSRVQLFTTPGTIYSPPGSSVHGIFQPRILESVAVSSSRGSPNPGIKPTSPSSPAQAGRLSTAEPLRSPGSAPSPR